MKKNWLKILILTGGLLGFLYLSNWYADVVLSHNDPHHVPNPILLLWLAIILFFGKIASGISERLNKPAVLGELIVGLFLGNLTLIGIQFLDPIKITPVINFLAQLGAIILYFQAGLSSNLANIKATWKQSISIAVLGLVFSFGLLSILLPILFPGHSQISYLFVAYALAPTGTGVAARVLQDLGKIKSPEAQMVLSTGAMDNIISYIVLAVFTAFITSGSVNVADSAFVLGKVLLLLVGIILFCIFLLPKVSQFIASIYSGRSLKFALAFSIGLLGSFMAQSLGISPIIGSFAAGLAINPSYFSRFKPSGFIQDMEQSLLVNRGIKSLTSKDHQSKIEAAKLNDLEDMFTTPSFLLVTLFFVVSGMAVNLKESANIGFILAAAIVLIGTVVAKFAAVAVIKRKIKTLLAAGLVPRVTTTLVFATVGNSLGVIPGELYSLIIFIVMLTTLVAPLLLASFIKEK